MDILGVDRFNRNPILHAVPPIKIEERGFIYLTGIKYMQLQCTWEPSIDLLGVKLIRVPGRDYEVMRILSHSDKCTVVDVWEIFLEPTNMPNAIAYIPDTVDDYWEEVARTRCYCGLSFGLHFPDCEFEGITFYDGVPEDEIPKPE